MMTDNAAVTRQFDLKSISQYTLITINQLLLFILFRSFFLPLVDEEESLYKWKSAYLINSLDVICEVITGYSIISAGYQCWVLRLAVDCLNLLSDMFMSQYLSSVTLNCNWRLSICCNANIKFFFNEKLHLTWLCLVLLFVLFILLRFIPWNIGDLWGSLLKNKQFESRLCGSIITVAYIRLLTSSLFFFLFLFAFLAVLASIWTSLSFDSTFFLLRHPSRDSNFKCLFLVMSAVYKFN